MVNDFAGGQFSLACVDINTGIKNKPSVTWK